MPKFGAKVRIESLPADGEVYEQEVAQAEDILRRSLDSTLAIRGLSVADGTRSFKVEDGHAVIEFALHEQGSVESEIRT